MLKDNPNYHQMDAEVTMKDNVNSGEKEDSELGAMKQNFLPVLPFNTFHGAVFFPNSF